MCVRVTRVVLEENCIFPLFSMREKLWEGIKRIRTRQKEKKKEKDKRKEESIATLGTALV